VTVCLEISRSRCAFVILGVVIVIVLRLNSISFRFRATDAQNVIFFI
jgi:hypothetical protein